VVTWNVTNNKVFLEYVSEDHYFTAVCLLWFLPDHQYKKPALSPIVDDSEFETYGSLVCTGTDVALSDSLAVNDTLFPGEHVLSKTGLQLYMIADSLVFREKLPAEFSTQGSCSL